MSRSALGGVFDNGESQMEQPVAFDELFQHRVALEKIQAHEISDDPVGGRTREVELFGDARRGWRVLGVHHHFEDIQGLGKSAYAICVGRLGGWSGAV